MPMCSLEQRLTLPPTLPGDNVCILTIAPASQGPDRFTIHSKVHLAKTSQAVALPARHGQIITLDVCPTVEPGTKVLFGPNNVSQLGPQAIIQEVAADGTIAVLLENQEDTDILWEMHKSLGWLQPLVSEVRELEEDAAAPIVPSKIQDVISKPPPPLREVTTRSSTG